jgi:stage IV sporulation protein FB
MRRLIHIGTFRSVPIFVHWSVPALAIFFLGAGAPRILMTAAGLTAYLAILLVHELGHQLAAVRLGYHVERIDVFPVHAICRFEAPHSARDAALIAWGGPIAQLFLAVPFTAIILTLGFTPFQSANAVLAILGYLNPLIALVNLTPIAPLDGKLAWTTAVLPRVRVRVRKEKTALEALEDAREKALRNARRK